MHFVECFNNSECWNIDTSFELFQRGLEEIFGNNFREAAIRFWEITRQMIEEDKPDIIGYLDKIKIFNVPGNYFNETESWYRDQVELTIKSIKKSGSIVKINTREYYRYNQTDLYPGEWIIARLHVEDIPKVLSSDAHRPEEIIKVMSYAEIRLKKMGLQKLSALYNEKWCQFSFSKQGLQIVKNR